jgi:hypothetical protein
MTIPPLAARLKVCGSARAFGRGPIPEATVALSRSIDGVGLADEALWPERRQHVRRVAEKSEPNIGILLAVVDHAAELLEGEGGAKRFGFQLTAAVMEFCRLEWARITASQIMREQN